MLALKNLILDIKIKLAEWSMQRLKKRNELTKDFLKKKKIQSIRSQKQIEKQKLLNQIKQEEIERKKIYLEKREKEINYNEQENEALLEILSALEEIDIEQVPSDWKRKLRVAMEKGEVLLIKEDFLRILRSHTLYEHYE